MSVVVVIPARYGSTRFPAKMLARDPRGRILAQYVYEAARRARGVDDVIVATDDRRILDAVAAWGGKAVMTSPDHASGSDRIAEVASGLPDCEIVLNVQGDEPQVRPDQIERLASLLRESPDCAMSTLVHRIHTIEELRDPNVVKCVLDAHGRALYFSRCPIPFVRGVADPLADSPVPHYRHLGMYGFRRDFLLAYTALPPAPVEQAEKLEQLRALHHGYRIRVGITEHRSIGVDTPEDFERFCTAVRREMEQVSEQNPGARSS